SRFSAKHAAVRLPDCRCGAECCEPHLLVLFSHLTYAAPNAVDAPPRLFVRSAFRWGKFPLASPLLSIPSITGRPVLFGDFAEVRGCPTARVRTFRRGPPHYPQRANTRTPGCRTRCSWICSGSETARDSVALPVSTPRMWPSACSESVGV